MNVYMSVHANPINGVDPLGLMQPGWSAQEGRRREQDARTRSQIYRNEQQLKASGYNAKMGTIWTEDAQSYMSFKLTQVEQSLMNAGHNRSAVVAAAASGALMAGMSEALDPVELGSHLIPGGKAVKGAINAAEAAVDAARAADKVKDAARAVNKAADAAENGAVRVGNRAETVAGNAISVSVPRTLRLPTSPAVGAAEGPVWGGNFSGPLFPSETVLGGQPLVLRPLVHGNSAASTRMAYLYRLTDAESNFLKWGITQNMATRYPKWYMEDKFISEFARGTRADMLRMERGLVETQPGPLNFERWAGTRVGGQP
jgi:hypothetical protein